MARVSLSKIEKTFSGSRKNGGFHAVKGIDLEVADGEFMVIVGPSGCGKSTTLRMIAGLESVDSGTIEIDGVRVNDVPPKDRDVSMVFQSYALYPHMTVFENMAFGLKMRKLGSEEIERRVSDAARSLGLDELLKRRPKALSGGQRQRVALGRAIVREPKVFLFDEPLSNLDAKMRVAMRAELAKLHQSLNATMIYVTHDQVEAMTMGDRICVMNEGRILQVDEPLAVYNNPANVFVAGFIGSPPMNLVRGVLRQAGERIEFVESADEGSGFSITLSSDCRYALGDGSERSVVLGIRAEDLAIGDASDRDSSSATGIAARVSMSEPTGSDTLVYLNSGTSDWVVVERSNRARKVGDEVELQISEDRIHFFDEATGDAIR